MKIKTSKNLFQISFIDEEWGKITKVKKVVTELVGGRKTNKGREYKYEIKYAWYSVGSGEYLLLLAVCCDDYAFIKILDIFGLNRLKIIRLNNFV